MCQLLLARGLLTTPRNPNKCPKYRPSGLILGSVSQHLEFSQGSEWLLICKDQDHSPIHSWGRNSRFLIQHLMISKATRRHTHKHTHNLHYFLFTLLFLKDFICLFERQRSQVGREAGRERERGGGSRLPAEHRAWCGTRSQDPDIMTWAEGRGLTHWATQMPIHYFLVGKNV